MGKPNGIGEIHNDNKFSSIGFEVRQGTILRGQGQPSACRQIRDTRQGNEGELLHGAHYCE